MALNPKLSNAAANDAADVVTTLLDSGYLRIYDGIQPATADTSITDQVLLAELWYGSPAFDPAVNGVAIANPLSDESDAEASGEATWFRSYKTDGVSVVFDGSVGTSGANLNLSDTNIVEHASVSISSHTYTQKKS